MDFDALTLEELRQRQSIKWRQYPSDVLPLHVAEMDVPLAPCVVEALTSAVALGDTGYAFPIELGTAFAGFARRQWGWSPDPAACFPVADGMAGLAEALRVLTRPGDGIVICPPVYRPFFEVPVEAGRTVVPVPLLDGALDLAGIDLALRAEATTVLLCSPHNPTGRVWVPEELAALDEVARRRDALVIADEVHAPLTLPGATFTPYLQQERNAVAIVSAAKAFNLGGLRAGLLVGGSPEVVRRMVRMSYELKNKVGHLGALASTAALREGDAWLAELVAHLDRQRGLLIRALPAGMMTPPDASFLAWLRFGTDSPAAALLREQRIALVEGTEYCAPGYARLNFGTTTGVLTEALARLNRAPRHTS